MMLAYRFRPNPLVRASLPPLLQPSQDVSSAAWNVVEGGPMVFH